MGVTRIKITAPFVLVLQDAMNILCKKAAEYRTELDEINELAKWDWKRTAKGGDLFEKYVALQEKDSVVTYARCLLRALTGKEVGKSYMKAWEYEYVKNACEGRYKEAEALYEKNRWENNR